MRLVTACLAGLVLASPLAAQQGESLQREHVVKDGDTLWDLAGFYFQNPFTWPAIYRANTTIVEDPHWIYPNEVLVIPSLAGETAGTDRPAQPAPVAVRPDRTVFYSAATAPPDEDQDPTVLSEPTLGLFPVKPGEFTAAPFLANPGRMTVLARVLEPLRENRESSGFTPSAHPQEELFLSYRSGFRPEAGDRLMMVDVQRGLGGGGRRIIVPTGIVEVIEAAPEVIRARIEAQYGPVIRGQLVIPMALFPDFGGAVAEPVPGPDLEGRIMEFLSDEPLYGPTEVAFINRGENQGVKVGDVFVAYLPERGSAGGFVGLLTGDELPPEAVAELRVIRVMDSNATVRVDRVVLPRLENGIRVRRVARMP
jgi:hypothetical protein